MKKILLTVLALVGSLGFASAQTDNVQVLIDSDFTVFTDGSEASPKSLYSSTLNAKCPGYYLISDVKDAGGKLLIGPSGYLQLKEFTNLPSAGGTIRVTVEVKMIDDYGGAIQYTRGYSTSDIVYAAVETDEWTTVTVYANGYTNTSTSRLKIQPYLSISGFYIKSLKVEYSPDFIAAPEAYLPTDADGTQFTASCSRVTGASKYEADVFSLNADNERVYFQQNVELKPLSVYSDPSAKITGLDPQTTYYYVARALNADGIASENSEPVEVVKSVSSVDAPEALAATSVTKDGFTANWNAVDNAKYYIVYPYEQSALTEAAEAPMFEEDFSGVTVGSVSNLEFSGDLNDFTKLPGWQIDSSKAYAAGYYVFSPFGDSGVLTTPTIDLSANEGKCSVVVKGFTGSYGTMRSTTNTIGAELLVNDEVVETAEAIVCNKTVPTDFVFNFTKGTANSRIRFTYTIKDDPYVKFYIDAITINQLMPAGTIIKKDLGNQSAEGTSADIKITLEEGKTYGYYVVAVAETVTGSGSSAAVGEIMSNESNHIEVAVPGTDGVDSILDAADAAKAWKEAEGTIGVNGSNIAVYDLAGRTLLRESLPSGQYSFNLGVRGVVIVTVDGTACKINL